MTKESTDNSKLNKKKPEDSVAEERPQEIGGPKGPEPTRYGDWQFKGRVSDF